MDSRCWLLVTEPTQGRTLGLETICRLKTMSTGGRMLIDTARNRTQQAGLPERNLEWANFGCKHYVILLILQIYKICLSYT